jgi:hypothetical protein
MQALRKEVSVIEQQIEVLDKYLKRLDKQPFGTAKETTAR